jgi:uncharacterized membrane protein YbhN (UPF0104 family)
MQFTHIISKKAALTEHTSALIKAAVFIGLAGYAVWTGIRKEIFSEEFFSPLWQVIQHNVLLFTLVVLLLPFNWGIEAFKWMKLISNAGTTSFWMALRGVLTGVAFGMATPQGLGDYAGRILQLSTDNRESMVGAVFLTRITQFSVTVLFGTAGLYYYVFKIWQPGFLVLWLLGFSAFITLVSVFLPFVFHKLLLKKLRNFTLFWKYFGVLYTYKRKHILNILWLSGLRYLVFCLQFMILFYIFGISTDWLLLFMAVNFIFLAKSVIPTLFELGVREYAAVFFFSQMGIMSNNIPAASLVLWIINILIPALGGSLFVFNLRFKIR